MNPTSSSTMARSIWADSAEAIAIATSWTSG